MKLSLSLVTLLVGISVATPLAASSKKSGAPGPPSSTFKKVKQQCSAKQSSIRCCNLDSKGGSKSSKSNVKHGGDNFNLSCQEFSGEFFGRAVFSFNPFFRT